MVAQPLLYLEALSRSPCVSETLIPTPPCSATVTSMRSVDPDCSQTALSSGVVSPSIWLHGLCQCSSGQATICITSMLCLSTYMIRHARPTVVPSLLCRQWRMSASLPSKREITWSWKRFATDQTHACSTFSEAATTKRICLSATTLVLQWDTTTTEEWAALDSGRWRPTELPKTKRV